MSSQRLMLVLVGLFIAATAFAEDNSAADTASTTAQAGTVIPDTITLHTGGGNKIESRFITPYHGNKWRFSYPDAPEVEKQANDKLAAEGTDISPTENGDGWYIRTVFLVTPDRYAPYSPKKGIRFFLPIPLPIGLAIVGTAAAAAMTTRSAYVPTATDHWGYATPLTADMLEGLPPGAKRVLVTRVLNPLTRATQDIMTVAYSDMSDEDLRWLNASFVFQLLEFKVDPKKQFGPVKDANDVCPSAWAFYTGRKPQPVKPVLATVVEVREIQIPAANSTKETGPKGDAAQTSALASVQQQASPGVSAVQIDYRPDSSEELKSVLQPKDLAPSVGPGDRIQVSEDLFAIRVAKAKRRS